ncbi:MAG: hypothetical protein RKE49_10875 [Oceanicaulis sp.]
MDKPAFNFTSAIFFFFKTLGRRPGAVAWIALWQLILYALVYAPAFVLLWPFYAEIFGTLAQGGEPDEAQVLQHVVGLIGGVSLAVIGGLLALLLAQAAWLRLMTRDEIAGGIPFRLGGDEVRLLGVNLLFMLANTVFWGVMFALVFVPNIVAVSSGGETGAVIGGAAVSALVGVGAVFLWIVLALKFSAAPAMSVQQRRFRFFGSFAATKGITAWLFLVYLVAVVIYVAGYMVISIIQQIVGLLVAADLIGAMSALDGTEEPEVIFSILGDLLSQPGVLIAIAVMLFVQLVFQLLFEAFWHGPGAYAALRHVNDARARPDDPIAPAGSVGDAPSEG